MPAESPQPQNAPTQCAATTGKGERCRAYAVKGGTLCSLHVMTPEERSRRAAEASARSAAVRAGIREEREDRVRSAKLGLTAKLAERLEEEADAVTSRLRDLALSSDPGVALQGIKLWLERVHGRAVQPTADVTEERNPLVEAFASLSPEERRQLLRLAQPLPEDEDPAAAQG